MTEERGRILGIGGIFFQSPDAPALRDWYHRTLNIDPSPNGALFPWRTKELPARDLLTVWSIFPSTTDYFQPGAANFMINYIVDDLDLLLEKLSAAGVRIDPKREDYGYGRFAWIFDPDGNKIELWQPLDS